jgi:SAM-dependent methyltransferase
MNSQDKTFLNYEGDNWFERNKTCFKVEQDPPLFLITIYNLKPKNVLEVGASNGYRLAQIHKQFKSKVYALEPSGKAIKHGKKKWPFINFQKATAKTMDYDKKPFDLVIVNSVFHWIDRDTLLNSIAKIDEALVWGGYLIIGDFQVYCPIKKRYHHIIKDKVFTFKVDYKKIFLSTGFYKEIATISKDHDKKILTGDTTIDNYFSTSLLKKEELYIER